MKTAKQKETYTAEKNRNIEVRWQLAALFTCVSIVILMLISLWFIKKEFAANYPLNKTYNAGDIALFVVMPMLDVVLK